MRRQETWSGAATSDRSGRRRRRASARDCRLGKDAQLDKAPLATSRTASRRSSRPVLCFWVLQRSWHGTSRKQVTPQNWLDERDTFLFVCCLGFLSSSWRAPVRWVWQPSAVMVGTGPGANLGVRAGGGSEHAAACVGCLTRPAPTQGKPRVVGCLHKMTEDDGERASSCEALVSPLAGA